MLIDSHCHVNFAAYKEDGEEVIQKTLAAGVWLINIGSQYSTSVRTITIAEKHPQGVYAVVGLHPIHLMQDVTEKATFEGETYEFTTKQEIFDYQKYLDLAKSSSKVVGLGETGLDYTYFDEFTSEQVETAKSLQRQVFKEFVRMSQQLDLPLVIHGRGTKEDNAAVYDEIIEILQSAMADGRKVRGVVHCFVGNLEQAQKLLKLGFYIGFTGLVTFKKKVEWLQEIARAVPIDHLLVETDAPFLSPEPKRGQRNEPLYVEYVAQKIAELKGLSFEQVADITTANARKLFNL